MERLPRLGFSLVAGVGLLAGGLASFGSVSAHTTPSNSALTANSSYVSVTPSRILDTRTTTPLTSGGMLQVSVPATVVPAGASAVVLNVTAVNPTAAGFLTVLPGGETLPTGSSLVSNLNFAAGAIVPNLVTVGLSATGTVELYNYTGSTDVVVDVEGYYTTPVTTSGLYNPISPVRVFGTLPIGTAIGAGATTAVTVAGALAADGVPASASAVVLNVTAAHATASSFLTVFPAGATMPTASNLNFGAQAPLQAIANRVTVGVGTSGNIDIYNHYGTVAVDVDVDGYYSGTGGAGSPFVAITPIRVADTVTANKVGSETAIAAAATETFTLATPDIPANAAGVAMNLTAVPGAAPGYLTSYPTSAATPPVASDVNWTASESPAVPNFTIADTAATGIAQNVDVANSYFTTGAPVDVIADVFGYFAAATVVPPSSLYTITVNPNPSTIPANALNTATSDSSVTATVFGKNTVPVANDAVDFLLTGDCGYFLPPGGGSGVYVAPDGLQAYALTGSGGTTTPLIYTAATAAGTCTVSVQEANQTATNSAVITQTPVGYTVTLVANPTNVTVGGADGSNQSTLTATVTFDGAPAIGDHVVFVVGTGQPSGTNCGTVPTLAGSPGIVTDSNGQAMVQYYDAGTTPGFCPITATEQNTLAADMAYVVQNNALTSTNAITARAVPNQVNAGAGATSTVSATVTGASNTGISGDPVMFVYSGVCGATIDDFQTTGSSGLTPGTNNYTSSIPPGVCTVTATEAFTDASTTTTITNLPVQDGITLTAAPATLTGNGLTTSLITATVTQPTGGALVGATVTFTRACYPSTLADPTLSPATGLSNGAGQISTTYTSSSGSGFCVVSASVGSGASLNTALVQIDQTSV
jgi:hypothetical protein